MNHSLPSLLFFGFIVSSVIAAQPEKTLAPAGSTTPSATAVQIEFFENKVRPVLVKNCFRCHGENEKAIKGGLRLTSREGILKGGDTGPAIVPGNPEQSLLVKAIRYKDTNTAMPPKQKLTDTEIAALTKWVEIGAPWPGSDSTAVAKGSKSAGYDWEKFRREHWSFKPITPIDPPEVKNTKWVKSNIDRFVMARLEAAKMMPNPGAEKHILIRRAYLDLIGIPPTPEQVKAFINDAKPDSLARVVDELLRSKHYGERWARHWLDVARYSDGLGGFLDAADLPNAWRYRDWVVQSLNEDMPYNEFVIRQIAGDVRKPETDAVATGFFAVGPTYISDGGDPEATLQAQAETLADRVDTFSRAFLGLTVACARCHDHKFDPITTKDYYAIAGVFKNTAIGEISLASKEGIEAQKINEEKVRLAQQALKQFTKSLQDPEKKEKPKFTQEEQKRIDQLKQEVEIAKKTAPPKAPGIHVLKENGNADMHVALKGDLSKKGDLAPRKFLQIIAGEDAKQFTEGSGRRELAEAVVQTNNPLTARVIVNRVWEWHFGEALVRTPGNFGTLGEKPTHPELLDWLAARFMANGWSLKWLHREIMLSATWQMSSSHDVTKFANDGDNRLLWRMNPRKLEVENWRDSLLAVTGELDRTIGGAPIEKILESNRRSLYARISRSGDRFESDAFFRTFDFPAAQATADSRTTTIVPQQYLFMMNNPFMINRGIALAKSLEPLESNEVRIRTAYEKLFSRQPEDREIQAGLAFVKDHPENWPKYAQVLLSTHEFLQMQ